MICCCCCCCCCCHRLLAGSYFALSLFDKMWHPNITLDEAVTMMEAGIAGACTGSTWPCGQPRQPPTAVNHFKTIFHPCPYALRCTHAGLTIAEVQKRLVVAPPHYIMKVVDKDGVREVKKV